MYNNTGIFIQLISTIILFGGFVTNKTDLEAFHSSFKVGIKNLNKLKPLLLLIGGRLLSMRKNGEFNRSYSMINGIMALAAISILSKILVITDSPLNGIIWAILGYFAGYIFIISIYLLSILLTYFTKLLQYLFNFWISLSSAIVSNLTYKFILFMLLIISFILQLKF